jgi:hypothetical protein
MSAARKPFTPRDMKPDPKRPAKSATPTPKRHGDRFAEINHFLDVVAFDLKRAEALTWLTLWRDVRQGIAKTSAQRIADRIGSTRRAVTTALKTLRKRKLISIAKHGGPGDRGENWYRVHALK